MLGPDDLAITASTLGSPPFPVLLDAAVAGGFTGLSMWPAVDHRQAIAAGFRPAELRLRLDDAGLVVHDVDALVAWVGAGDPGPPYLEEAPPAEVVAAAGDLGAALVNVLLVGDPSAGVDAAATRFAAICDQLAERGLGATIEFRPGGPVPDLATALAVVAAADHPVGGVLLDVWHHHWSTDGDVLGGLAGTAGSLARIRTIQLNDAPARRPADLSRASRHERLSPGEGAVPLVDLLGDLRTRGCAAPAVVEVFSDALWRSHGPEALARRLGAKARAVLDQTGSAR